MTSPDYPLEITPAERDLGFRRVELESFDGRDDPLEVVALLLSSSDVLVKIIALDGDVRYSLRRFGYDKKIGRKNLKWHPLYAPITPDLLEYAISRCKRGETPDQFEGEIVEVPAKSRFLG